MRYFHHIFLLIAILFSSVVVRSQIPAGTYTIGGINPDYPSFSSAASSLSLSGISGPVIFHVREGLYTEQVLFENIPGASASATVEFRPDPLNTQPVELTYSPTYTGLNYTVLFHNQASFIKLSNLRLSTGGTSFARVVCFQAASYITLDSNEVIGAQVASTSSDFATVYNPGNPGNYATNITISNNTITNGSYGLYWYGVGTAMLEPGSIISDNDISGFYRIGIEGHTQENCVYKGNRISSPSGGPSVIGMNVFYNSEPTVTSNVIEVGGSNNPVGFKFSQCNGTAANPGRIFNNFIVVNGGSSAAYGIHGASSGNISVDFNSVNVMGGSAISAASYLSVTTYDTVYFRNNNLSSAGGNLALSIPSSSAAYLYSDYNNLFTTGTWLVNYGGTNYDSLHLYQTASSLDSNSLNVDPFFYSSTNLHSYSYALNDAGTLLGYVSVDIDNESRSVTPDIGADEYFPLQEDAGILHIDTPSMASCSPGDVYVTVINYGTDTLNSITVNWGVNGISQVPVTVNISLAPTMDTILFTGTATIQHGDTIFAFTSNPNGNPENPIGAINDYSEQITIAGMSGTFAIGGVNADYYSYTDAVSDLAVRGVCGPVVFLVNDSTYTEQIQLPVVTGATSINTITFRSASGDSSLCKLTFAPSGSFDNYVIQTYGASHYVFENITLENTASYYGRVINIYFGSEDISLKNCNLINYATSSSSPVIYTPNNANVKNIRILNNNISGGDKAILINGGTFVNIENNRLYNQISGGVSLFNIDTALVEGNVLSTIYLSPYTYSYTGVYGHNLGNFSVIGNQIFDTADVPQGYGIYISNSDGGTAKSRIENNMISKGGPATAGNFFSVTLINSQNIIIAHNSTNVSGSSTSLSLQVNGGGNIEVVNNSFVMNTPGTGLNYINSSAISFSDYNNIYVPTGGTTVKADNSSYATLSLWQAASGKDLNSLSAAVNYFSIIDLHNCSPDLKDAGLIGYSNVDFDWETRDNFPDIGADEFSLQINLIASQNPVCQGDTSQISITNPIANLTYNWSPNTGINTGTGQNVLASPTVNTAYTVTANNSGCNYTGSILLNVLPLPLVSFSLADSVCINDGLVALTGSPAGGSFGGPGVSGSSFNPAVSGLGFHMLTYSVTDTNGCSALDTGNISVTDIPVVTLGNDTSLCMGESFILDAGPGHNSYLWSDNSVSQTIAVNSTGSYHVTVTNTDGCQNSDTAQIIFAALPAVDLGNDTIICQGNSLVLDAGPGFSSYLWSDNSTSQTITVSSAGNYHVTISSPDGCVNSDSIVVLTDPCTGVEEQNRDLVIEVLPNPSNGTFTLILSGEEVQDINIEITDLSGKRLYSFSQANLNGEFRKNLNLNLSSGIYFLTAGTAGFIQTERLLIRE